ncbi:uncharacterized protein LOC117179397 isoform X2 [Belonocnema kinseyi]|nr:uncharacterized protein LOC117179397 isoform X2 [Belonocnema kinseyi]
MELHRLEPYFEGSAGFPKIQVLNMPNVKLRQVELLGIIRKITSRSRLDLTIDDGTGKIQVLLQFSQMGEMKEERKLIDAKFQRFEKIAVLQKRGLEHMQDLERRWRQETKNGTLGMSFKVFEHVHVIGTIHVDFGNHNLNKRSLCLDTAKFVKPVIHAKRIYHLSEEEYNEKLQSWISGVVRERYQKL